MVTKPTKLSSFSQAKRLSKWNVAMRFEFEALQKNGTWYLDLPTLDMNILSNKWVYKIKQRYDGSIDRYKACLVTNGIHQQYGMDYTKSFSSVVKHTTIHIVLALVMHQK